MTKWHIKPHTQLDRSEQGRHSMKRYFKNYTLSSDQKETTYRLLFWRENKNQWLKIHTHSHACKFMQIIHLYLWKGRKPHVLKYCYRMLYKLKGKSSNIVDILFSHFIDISGCITIQPYTTYRIKDRSTSITTSNKIIRSSPADG